MYLEPPPPNKSFWLMTSHSFRGFVNLKKFKKEKTQKWVRGSSPNSDFFFFWNIVVFFVVFFIVGLHVSKKNFG